MSNRRADVHGYDGGNGGCGRYEAGVESMMGTKGSGGVNTCGGEGRVC